MILKDKGLLFFIFFTLFNYSVLQSQSFSDQITDIALEHKLVGLSVAFVCGDGPPQDFHYGKSSLCNFENINSATKYRIASISKAVTATALMVLYDQELFELDDPVLDYLGFDLVHPSYPDESITIRMLLNHTSGLRDGNGYFNFLRATSGNSNPPLLSQLLHPGGIFFTTDLWGSEQPGTYFNYANINFGLIATIIESISAERFDLFVRDELLLPLGITGSFNISHLPDINDLAVLYRNSNPQVDDFNGTPPTPTDLSNYQTGTNGFIFAPQGGLRVSALELAYFIQLHLNDGSFNGQEIISPEAIQLLHHPEWTYGGNNGNNYYNLFNEWGLGFHRTTNQPQGDIIFSDFNMVGHPGEAYGLISDCYFNTENQFGLVFVTNGYYEGSGYEFGDYSAYYTPEEDIFTAINNSLLNPCLSGYSNSSEVSEEVVFLSPNPVNGAIRVQGEPDQLRIYSTCGRLHLDYSNNSVSTIIELPTLPDGIYYVQMEKNGYFFTRKLLIIN